MCNPCGTMSVRRNDMTKDPPRLVLEIALEKRIQLRKIAALRETTMKALVEDFIDRILRETPIPDAPPPAAPK